MAKLLLILIFIVVLGATGYFFVFNKSSLNLPVPGQKTQVVKNPIKTAESVPTPQPTVVATDQSLDSDMTALDQDLASLGKLDSSFATDLNGL